MPDNGNLSKYYCEECKEGTFPWRYQNQQICITQSEKTEFFGYSTQITDCDVYASKFSTHNDNTINRTVQGHICIRCSNGKFPDSTNTSCVTSCSNTNQVILLDKVYEPFYNHISGGNQIERNKFWQSIYYKYKGCYDYSGSSASQIALLENCHTAVRVTGISIAGCPNNCANYSEPKLYACVKCKSDATYLKLVYKADDAQVQLDSQSQYNTLLVSYNWQDLEAPKKFGYQYTSFQCQAQIPGHKFVTTNDTIWPLNCEIFSNYPIGANTYQCEKCKFGYTGLMKFNNNEDIPCDLKVINCDRQKYYGGFFINSGQRQLNNNWVNCHECIAKDHIPFLFFKHEFNNPEIDNTNNVDEYDNKPEGFDIKYGITKANTNSNNNNHINEESHWIKCIRPSAKAFRMPEERYQAMFPANCAIGIFNTDSVKDFRNYIIPEISLTCHYCKPGHRAHIHNGKIQRCQKIAHCDMNSENKWFDGCSQCKQGYAWRDRSATVKEEIDIRFDECVPTKDLYCQVQRIIDAEHEENKRNPNTDTFTRCTMCKKGYSLDLDGKCEVQQFPHCDNNMYNGQYAYYSNENNFLLVLYDMLDLNTGCNKCSNGFIGFFNFYDYEEACSSHQELFLKGEYSQSKYIENCRTYYRLNTPNNGVPVSCKSCNPNYILTTDHRHCFLQSTFPNCLEVENTFVGMVGRKCTICNTGFYLIKGHCEKGKINFCKAYEIDERNQICNTCEDYFQLENGFCVPGEIKNCKVYNLTTCIQCDQGHKKLNIKDSTQYCVKMPTDLKCTSFGTNNDAEVHCGCNELQTHQTHVITDTVDLLKQSICVNLILIENCETYDNTLVSLSSSYTCSKCSSGFFLKNNMCNSREKLTDNCQLDSPTEDYCIECLEGFYLTNEKECEAYPTGIVNCINYKSETECTACQQNYYLKDNLCNFVPLVNRIMNCKLYQDKTTCSRCEQSYYLQIDSKTFATTCLPAMALHCLEYEDNSNGMKCSKCDKGYGFQDDFSKKTINCTYISSPNCLKNSLHFPFECLQCETLYYINNGICISVSKFIKDCEIYSSSKNCFKCEKGYILNEFKDECLEQRGFLMPYEDCLNTIQSVDPECKACKEGHKFDEDGNCIPCLENTLVRGCLFCSGQGQDEKCVVCKQGYYMTNDKKCYENGKTAAPTA